MPNRKSTFEQMLNAMTKTGDATLRLYYQNKDMLDALLNPEERKRLVEDIGQYVIEHINATVDAQEVFDAIDGLNDKINSLGK